MGYNADDYISGQYLNAQVAKEKKLTNKNLLVVDVTQEEFQKGDNVKLKLALKFAETDRMLVLNSTNTSIMKEGFGSDTDNWKNKIIQLVMTKTKYMGELVDSILVNPITEARQGGLSSSSSGE